MSERLVDRCCTCGEAIYEGEPAWKGPGGELYCDEWCAVQALATEVTAGVEEDIATGMAGRWTYAEAVQLAQAYVRLAETARELVAVWRTVAHLMEGKPAGMSVAYRQCADRLEEALEETSPAGLGTGAGDGAQRAEA